jgi:phage tail protein X
MALNITELELVTVQGDYVTADLLIWRRYRCPTPGLVEAMLDLNPELSRIHRETPFIPPGTEVRIPIDPDLLAQRPKPVETVTLYGRVKT